MANFEPSGIIKIGSVPWDNSYSHTVGGGGAFTDKASQATFMQGFMDYNLTEYKYVRMNNSIKVAGNAERYYTCNYVMYQNANYGSKWFYAFITDIQYVNENTTALMLELDVMQTWFYDWSFTQCFVEREHVTDDSIGAHLNAEPEFGFDMVAKTRFSDPILNNCYIIMQTNAMPVDTGNPFDPNGTQPVNGGIYNKVFNGSKYYAFDPSSTGDIDTLKSLLYGLNAGGGAESISNIFMFPKTFTPNIGTDHGVEENQDAQSYKRAIGMPTSLGGGYVPRNNKLFTYPYCYFMVDDNAGNKCEYKYEYWDTPKELSVQSALDPDAMCIVAPLNYNGIGNDVPEALTFPLCPRCSWTYSSYQNWSAQNQIKNVLSAGINAGLMFYPAAKGLSAAGKLLSTSRNIKAAKGAHTAKFEANALRRERAQAWNAFDTANTASLAGAGFGAYGMANLAGEISYQSRQPNVTKGAASGNTLFANGYMTYNGTEMVIREEWAKIIDGFFDMYGYQVDSLKVPNWANRPSWNYVKVQNPQFHGNVPAPDMAQINAIHEAGITYWHTADVGNYSLNNK